MTSSRKNLFIKIISLVISLIFVLSLCACADREASDATDEKPETKEPLVFTPIEPDTEESGKAGTPESETAEPASDTEPAGSDTDTVPPETEPYVIPETSAANSVPAGDGIAPMALMYHLILDEPFSSLESLFVRPSELDSHIKGLLDAGYTFIFAEDYGYYDTKTVIMTFDDGYLDNYTEMFPIIKKYNVKVTVFMIGGYIGGADYLSADMIKEMSASGLVSFQSHTQSHQDLTTLSPESLRYEFSASNETIEALTGKKIRAICYPTGAYNDTVTGVASEFYDFGYTTESQSSTAGYPLLTLPRLRVPRGWTSVLG